MLKTPNLLTDLHRFLSNHISGQWNSEDLYFYILEYATTSSTRKNSQNKNKGASNATQIEDPILKKVICKLMKNWQPKNNPDISDIIIKKIWENKAKVINIYVKHQIKYDSNTETTALLTNLFYICLSENAYKFSPSYRKKNMTSETFKTTVGRDSNATELKVKLEQHRKIIISGKLGSGKTHFIKYCLKKWKTENFCYIDYDYIFNQNTHPTDDISAIQNTLNKIEYSDSNKYIYRGSYHELENDIFSSSLLVIDNMYLLNDLDKILDWLSELKPMIIVLSLLPAKTSSFYSYELPGLSDSELLDIFETNSGYSIQKNKTLQEQLLMVSGRNILIISLIAKLYTALKEPKTNWLTEILNYLSCLDNNYKITETTTKYKHSYDKESLTIINHLKRFYAYSLDVDSDDENFNLRTYMKWLSCFGYLPLPLNFTSCTIPNYQKANLKKLHELGLVTLTDNTIQLSPSISYAVFKVEKPYGILTAKKYPYNKNVILIDKEMEEFNLIFDNLIRFLKTYDDTLSVPYLSTSLLTFAKALYPKVPTKYNPNQQTTSAGFEKWQDLLYLIQNYYNQNGDYFLSKEVIRIIFYPEDSKNKHNPLDKNFFDCINNMHIEDFLENIPKQLDDLCFSINKSSEFTISPTIISILNNTMDLIIGFFSVTSLEIVRNPDNYLLNFPIRF